MAATNLTQEMKRHAMFMTKAANNDNSDIACFLKEIKSFVFKVRHKLKMYGKDVSHPSPTETFQVIRCYRDSWICPTGPGYHLSKWGVDPSPADWVGGLGEGVGVQGILFSRVVCQRFSPSCHPQVYGLLVLIWILEYSLCGISSRQTRSSIILGHMEGSYLEYDG